MDGGLFADQPSLCVQLAAQTKVGRGFMGEAAACQQHAEKKEAGMQVFTSIDRNCRIDNNPMGAGMRCEDMLLCTG